MKKDDVQVGQVYTAKVTDKLVPVRIVSENPHGGWNTTNLATGRSVRIKSAQRLRAKVDQGDATDAEFDQAAAAAAAVVQAPRPAQAGQAKCGAKAATSPTAAKGGRGAKVDAKAKGKAKAATRAKQGDPKAKRASGLDAAARVLAETKKPMGVKEIVEVAFAKGYWSTGGKTPEATIYSAIIREIAAKGKDARFKKVDRGRFARA